MSTPPYRIRSIPAGKESTLNAVLAEEEAIQTKDSHLYVLVIGEREAKTGQSWCGDCREAEPVIAKVLSTLKKLTVIECSVDRASYKGNPNHPYRLHPKLKLRSVPTLYRWVNSNPLKVTVENDLKDEKLIRSML